MIALRNALSRSVGFFGAPYGTALPQRAIITVFRRIYTEVNTPLGKSLQGRTSLNPSCSFSSGTRPVHYKGPPFPDGETIKEFISEHPKLATPQFLKGRLNIAIATLCADRFALRTMSDDRIATIIMKIYTDLSRGKDEATGEEIQQYNLTPSMCVSLDRDLPLILKECATKHAITSGKTDTLHAASMQAPIQKPIKLNPRMFHSCIRSAPKSGLCTLANTIPPFPDADTIEHFVANHPQLARPYFKKIKGVIATLCAHRFANRSLNTRAIQIAAEQIICDVTVGKDGSSGEEVQKLELNLASSMILEKVLPAILQECAQKCGPEYPERVDFSRCSGS